MKGLYEQAVLPEPFTILGKHLKPFSFGHFIILRRFNVGFVLDNEAKPTLEDLLFAIYICSHTWPENNKLLYSGNWHEDFADWGKQYAEYELSGHTIDWPQIQNLFESYKAYHTVLPKWKARRTDSSPINTNAEWYEGILKTMMQWYTSDQLMDMCFSRVMYEFLAYKESQGEILLQVNIDNLDERRKKQLEAILERRKQLKEQHGG